MANGAAAVDGGQVWLVNCLNATLDANPQIRTAAEEALKQASVHAGLSLFYRTQRRCYDTAAQS
jgi:hypothetical protein